MLSSLTGGGGMSSSSSASSGNTTNDNNSVNIGIPMVPGFDALEAFTGGNPYAPKTGSVITADMVQTMMPYALVGMTLLMLGAVVLRMR